MATNPMLWVGYPRSYTPGRARPVQFVTLHYTAGSEGPTSAESGAAYDKTRTDGTSCHAFFDSQGPGLQEVPFGDRSHSAFFHGNEIGIHFEICGTIQTRDQWLDATSMATLRTLATAVAYTCDTLGLAKRRLSVAETRAAYYNAPGSRPTGINDHAAITLAFPEDGGDHMDVGTAFPWDVFMPMVTGSSPEPQMPNKEDDVVTYILQQDGVGIVLAWPDSKAKKWVYTNIVPPTGNMPNVPEFVGKLQAAGCVGPIAAKFKDNPMYVELADVPDPTITVGNVSFEVGDLTFTGKITKA